MRVDNFPYEKRLTLLNKWEKLKEKHIGYFDPDSDSPYDIWLMEGNYIYINPDQLRDPNYIIPEWGDPVPNEFRQLYSKIGKLCYINNGDEKGIFAGIVCSYVDFYYRIIITESRYTNREGKEILESCVGKITFYE